MSVIVCRKEQVAHPYYIENLGVRVYTSQELCYAIYHHPLLMMDGFVDLNLIGFIREELNMGLTALKLERRAKSGERQDELIFLFLQECNYYTTVEINQLRQKVAALRKLPPLEYAKKKADYLFEYRQYGKAIANYERILEDPRLSKADDSFTGRVWNNLGACYARVFRFEKAKEALEKAYEKLTDPVILERLYHLTCFRSGLSVKKQYLSLVTAENKEAWDWDLKRAREQAENSEEVKTVEELFAKDSIRRLEGARQMVEAWKQEYRSMA